MSLNSFPVHHLESIPIGYSKPQLILFNDGLKYVVKFKNNPTGTRVLVNEYVAGRLAQLLSLPVPHFQITPISDAFIQNTPVLADHGFMAGNQFASLYIADCSFLTAEFLPPNNVRLRNRDLLAGMIVFDLWLSNTDRKEKNFLLKPLGEGDYVFYMIDHGRCFVNSNWTPSSLKKINMELELKVHKWCAFLLKGAEEMDYFLKQIMSLPDQDIRGVVRSIPLDWNVSAREKEALFAHLMNARKKLPAILEDFIRKTSFDVLSG